MNFLHEKDLGFNKEQVIYFSAQGKVGNDPETFKTELLRSPGVISATAGYGLPGDQLAGDGVKVLARTAKRNKQPIFSLPIMTI